jgi:ankyrin repeat protein
MDRKDYEKLLSLLALKSVLEGGDISVIKLGGDDDDKREKEKPLPKIFKYLKDKKTANDLDEFLNSNPNEDVNVTTGIRGTPLLFAIGLRALDKVIVLLKHGADPNQEDSLKPHGYKKPIKPIFMAVGFGLLAIADALIDAGADLNATYEIEESSKKMDLFAMAYTFGKQNSNGDPIAILKWVVDMGKIKQIKWQMNFRPHDNDLNKTLLGMAIHKGHLASADLMLQNGADPNLADDEGWTPLHTACMNDQANVALLLIMHGADETLCTKGKKSWAPPEKADIATKRMIKNAIQYRERLAEKSKPQPTPEQVKQAEEAAKQDAIVTDALYDS